MQNNDRVSDEKSLNPVDNLMILLRAYAASATNNKRSRKVRRRSPSDWVLVFDCETRTTPDQRLRIGAYQLRYKGSLWERGAFCEPETVSSDEITLLRSIVRRESHGPDGERICLRTRAEFVEKIFYKSAYDVGAQIVGFNLPFDLSRLAIDYDSARGEMRGGFSLLLLKGKPRVIVRHLSQRAAFIQMAGIRPGKVKGRRKPTELDRGYFVDVKTLAAALTSTSHSLESLAEQLKIPTLKTPSDDHGAVLTPEYIDYALRDVQTTWECFATLAKKVASFALKDTGLFDLYSEASLGKAYLRTMNVKPWREVQPDFSPERIGQILSTYYGGRAEVHIRRQIVPVIHCDFMSMYPTVCTLMGLWTFVCSQGITFKNCTADIRTLLQFSSEELVNRLRRKESWPELLSLVQVLPNRDLFPVRAKYPDGTGALSEVANIGLNYLTSTEPQWFTLADALVSKILTGKTPEIVAATRFGPKKAQERLKPIVVAGDRIEPATDDFYRRLIVHRIAIKARLEHATEAEAPAIESDALATKILANATSYGIFVELNVRDLGDSKKDRDRAKTSICYTGQGQSFKFETKTIEEPGTYFHPLLATLITGAARLMLALAEYQVLQQGLDWAFCDTDSLAIANTHGLSGEEFKAKALQVVDWFKDLNPYGGERSILQLEKVNFPPKMSDDLNALDPPLCLAVSAKRYALFNKRDGAIVIRKASGHGLGHLTAPHDEPAANRRERIKRIGIPLWQEHLWKEIIRATESDTPEQVRFLEMPGFDTPAASQYAATTPELLRWFEEYNTHHPKDRIFPFGFLLSLQAKSRMEMVSDDPDALSHELWRRREPRPASPFFKSPSDAKDHAFDRERGTKIPASWLKSLGRTLARYHLHPETKFLGGDYEQRGLLQRRHVRALGAQSIGKEADNLEENEFIGEDAGPLEYSVLPEDQRKATGFIINILSKYQISDRTIVDWAGVSHRTLSAFKNGKAIAKSSLNKLVRGAEGLRREMDALAVEREEYLRELRELSDNLGGRNKLAESLGFTAPYVGRVLRGEKPMTDALIKKLKDLVDGSSSLPRKNKRY